MIKHLFSDMDGTVLNSKGEISEANINAIKKSELPFTFVSARSPQKMENIINTLGIDGIHVSFNGALIFKKKNNKKRILTIDARFRKIVAYCSIYRESIFKLPF